MGSHCTFMILVIVSMVITCVTSDSAKDKQECTEQLVGMATCLPYVGGDAKAPTPDCCSGLKQVLQKNKKCLCVIIKDRNDPDLGLNLNATLALGLPSVCHAPANVSQCPALLHLAPNSPDAQVFYQFANSSNGTASSTPSTVKSNSSASANSKGVSAQGGCCNGKKWLNLEFAVGGTLLWLLTSNLLI
ncbi:hypothetical protein AAG906_012651 [Vitis piasezkii]|uniref:Protein YLS3 n=2 Tax=Vitis vinifera TaxID=29760 RepID=D7TNT3_VITVI|eukprot:XP_002270671.1 PREDICTED: protein YLS3 [Vitis vinifera]